MDPQDPMLSRKRAKPRRLEKPRLIEVTVHSPSDEEKGSPQTPPESREPPAEEQKPREGRTRESGVSFEEGLSEVGEEMLEWQDEERRQKYITKASKSSLSPGFGERVRRYSRIAQNWYQRKKSTISLLSAGGAKPSRSKSTVMEEQMRQIMRMNQWLYRATAMDSAAAKESLSSHGTAFSKLITFISVIVLIFTTPISWFFCIKVIREYERAVLFRLGKLLTLGPRGPGLFLINPFLDTYKKIDLRTNTFDVQPQEILTKDSVTVCVDAVVFFRISNPVMSVTNVNDAYQSTRLLAQSTLRNVLGTRTLAEILSDRDTIATFTERVLDEGTDHWGVKVERVEMKHIRLPRILMRVMAIEAEASRIAKAKFVAAEGERLASGHLTAAAEILSKNPMTIRLRYLQTLQHIANHRCSTVVLPIPTNLANMIRNCRGVNLCSTSTNSFAKEKEANDSTCEKKPNQEDSEKGVGFLERSDSKFDSFLDIEKIEIAGLLEEQEALENGKNGINLAEKPADYTENLLETAEKPETQEIIQSKPSLIPIITKLSLPNKINIKCGKSTNVQKFFSDCGQQNTSESESHSKTKPEFKKKSHHHLHHVVRGDGQTVRKHTDNTAIHTDNEFDLGRKSSKSNSGRIRQPYKSRVTERYRKK